MQSASQALVYTSQTSAVLRSTQRDVEAQDRFDRLIEARYPPTSINSARPYDINAGGAQLRDSLGGLMYSPEFERFIKHSLPRSVELARRLWIEWWRLPYVLGRVTTLLGREMADHVLALVRDRVHPRELERRSRRTLRVIAEAKSRAMRLVRRLLPYEYYDHPHLLAQALAD